MLKIFIQLKEVIIVILVLLFLRMVYKTINTKITEGFDKLNNLNKVEKQIVYTTNIKGK